MKKPLQNKTTILLSGEQVELLQPLFDYAEKQAKRGKKGLIFAQPYQNNFTGCVQYNEFRCAFVEEKYATKMVALSVKATTLIKTK